MDFVYGQAKAQNDLNLSLSINSQPYSKGERTLFKPSGIKTVIAVHKTDVSATVDTGYTASTDNDPARYCPVQKSSSLGQMQVIQNNVARTENHLNRTQTLLQVLLPKPPG